MFQTTGSGTFFTNFEYSHHVNLVFHLETYSETFRTSNMELFAKIVNEFHLLNISAKSSILDVWQGSEYAYVTDACELICPCWSADKCSIC